MSIHHAMLGRRHRKNTSSNAAKQKAEHEEQLQQLSLIVDRSLREISSLEHMYHVAPDYYPTHDVFCTVCTASKTNDSGKRKKRSGEDNFPCFLNPKCIREMGFHRLTSHVKKRATAISMVNNEDGGPKNSILETIGCAAVVNDGGDDLKQADSSALEEEEEAMICCNSAIDATVSIPAANVDNYLESLKNHHHHPHKESSAQCNNENEDDIKSNAKSDNEKAESLPGKSMRKQKQKNIRMRKPPGIENLGATCYLNSQLQCFASFPPFCDGILSVNQQTLQTADARFQAVVTQLQRLLANLKIAPSKQSVSAEGFAKALGLEEDAMQDPLEFSRLLLDKMESSLQCLCGSKNNTLVDDMFRGTCRFETTCSNCGVVSKTPEENFYDLLVPIVLSDEKAAYTNVGKCISAHLLPEVLDGTNKYHCSKCKSPQEAKRRMKLLHVPPILSIQLSRYSYDFKAGTKKKITDKVESSSKLRLHGVDYMLVALQHHVGGGANSGHYIAETMDWATGQWFAFDDEKVSHAEGPNSLNSLSAAKSQKKKKKANGKKLSQEMNSNMASSTVYNLFYVSSDYLRSVNVKRKDNDFGKGEVARDVRNQRKRVFESERKRQNLRKEISLYLNDDCIINNKLSENVWVARDSLRAVACLKLPKTWSEVEGVKLCEHNRLHPDIFVRGKLISDQVIRKWNVALKAFSGGRCGGVSPTTPANDLLCPDCFAHEKEKRTKHIERLQKLVQISHCTHPTITIAEDDENCVKEHVVSKKFVSALRKHVQKCLDGSCCFWEPSDELDPTVNSNITCESHGKLNAAGSRYVVVSDPVWQSIVKYYPTAIALNLSSGSKCLDCLGVREDEKEKVQFTQSNWESWIVSVKSNPLLKNVIIGPSSSASHMLKEKDSIVAVCHKALQRWRRCLYEIPDDDEADCIDANSYSNPYFCKSHGRSILPIKLADLTNTGDLLGQTFFDGEDALELLTEAEYDAVCNSTLTLKKIFQLYEDVDIVEDAVPSAVNFTLVQKDHSYKITPPVCVECMSARRADAREWTNRPVFVTKLRSNEEPPVIDTAPKKVVPTKSRRKSRRVIKTQEKELMVSSDDSLAKLRLHIHEQIGEPLLDQELFFRGQPLPLGDSQQSLTLKSQNIEPHSKIYIRYPAKKYARGERAQLEESIFDYLMSCMGMSNGTNGRIEGFGGTFLSSSTAEMPALNFSDANSDVVEVIEG